MTNTNKEQTLRFTNLNKIGTLYKDIIKNKDTKLYLSPNIKFKHLGGSCLAIQFICSWQRYNECASIILDKQIDIDNLDFKSELLLVAFYLAKKVLFNGNDIKKDILIKFIPFVKNMNSKSLDGYFKQVKAREYKFLFLHKAENEFLKLFYNDNKYIKSKKDIKNLIGNILEKSNSNISKNKYDKNLDNIKEIIYEVLHNTDKHGRRDINQIEISKNIRGLSINISNITDDSRQSFLKNQQKYSDFLQNVEELLTISIFDSGEGIVKKYIETTSNKKINTMNVEEQKTTLLEVFMPNVTSSKIPNSGMGLTYVKDNIKKLKGLLSIKTNALELFFTPSEEGYEDELIDCVPCVGTSVIILIPLNFKEL